MKKQYLCRKSDIQPSFRQEADFLENSLYSLGIQKPVGLHRPCGMVQTPRARWNKKSPGDKTSSPGPFRDDSD
jgi:hypothetical protein